MSAISCVIELQQWRHAPQSLSHPAGVSLPFEEAGCADLLILRIRTAIARGQHCADTIRSLLSVVRPGERVLVIGSGLGVLSTLLARMPGVERVIVTEPDIELAGYLETVHQANDVTWIEVLNAVPAETGPCRVPVFVRHDVRASSLDPDDGAWERVMLVPGVDLDLILSEEHISLIVAESPVSAAPLLSSLGLGSVDSILVGSGDGAAENTEKTALTAHLAAEGFRPQGQGIPLAFHRTVDGRYTETQTASAW